MYNPGTLNDSNIISTKIFTKQLLTSGKNIWQLIELSSMNTVSLYCQFPPVVAPDPYGMTLKAGFHSGK